MIKIEEASNSNQEQFHNYNDLFDYIVDRENHKMLEIEPDFKNMQWSFTAYSSRHAQTLFMHMKDRHPAIKEASENQFALIEVCTGDFSNPEYHVGKPGLDIKTLKKKWVEDYCAAHNQTITQA